MTIEECYTKLESDYREIVPPPWKGRTCEEFLSLFFLRMRAIPPFVPHWKKDREKGVQGGPFAESKESGDERGTGWRGRSYGGAGRRLKKAKLFEQVRKEYVRTVAPCPG